MRTFPGCVLPLLAVAALALSACDEPVPDGVVDGTCADLTHGEEAWFDAEIQPLFDTYCTICHASTVTSASSDVGRRGAVPLVDFDTHESAVLDPDTTWSRMIDRTMPPMGRVPSTAELETLLDFLNCAAAIDDALGDDDDSAL